MRLTWAKAATLALALTGVAPFAGAADKPLYAPPPDWVKPVDLPTAAPAQSGALQVLLSDMQIRFVRGRRDFYQERAIKILNPVGLSQAGNLSFVWDPETEVVTLHKVRIIRGDKVIDLIDKPDRVTVLRRETNLELSMLDGSLTAVIQPEGLQAGDIVDFAYTLTDQDPIWQGRSEGYAEAPEGLPAQRFHVSATWGADQSMRWRLASGLGEPKVEQTNAGKTLVVDRSDFEAPQAPADAPDRFQHQGLITFSDFTGWAEVAGIMAPLYRDGATLAPGSPVRAEALRIAAQSADPKVRATMALHLVQQQVRYLFLALNQGGLKPADADVTWARRFGDCKGKSVLLVALLHELGIQAEPVLVSTTSGDGLPQSLPGLGRFDHVIVVAHVAGKTYWLDGTRLGDRNLDDLRPPQFEWGLPLVAAGAQLMKIDLPPLDKPTMQVSRRIDLSAGPDAPAPIRLELVTSGDLGFANHMAYAAVSRADLDKQLRATFARALPWVTPNHFDEAWNEGTGEMRVTVEGTAQIPWVTHAGGRHFDIPASDLGAEVSLRRQPGVDAEAPFALPYPMFAINRTVLVLPNKGAGYTLEGGGDVDRVIAGIAYQRTSEIRSGVATLESSVRSLQREFPAADAEGAQQALDTLAENPVWLERPVASAAAAPVAKSAPSFEPEPTSAADFAQRGLTRLLEHDVDRAIADYSRSIELDPKIAKTFYNRGVAFAAKGDFQRAREDFDVALRLEPASPRVLSSRARVRFKLGDAAGARNDLQAAIAAAPDSIETAWAAARAFEEAGRYQDAIATYDRLVTRFPDDPKRAEMLNERCWTHAQWGQGMADGLADCEAALSLRPGNPAFLDSRAMAELRMGRLAPALRDYDAALAARPTNAESLYGRGLVKLRQEDDAAGGADLQVAEKLDAGVAVRFAGWGLRP